jgi:hypothetical protein
LCCPAIHYHISLRKYNWPAAGRLRFSVVDRLTVARALLSRGQRSQCGSNGDPLDHVAGDLLLATVVKACGAGVGVAGQVLHLVERHALLEQVGDAFGGFLGAFTDSGSSGPASSFTVSINWGDGNTSAGTVTANGQGGFNIAGSHTFATAGVFTVTITVTDANGASTTITDTITVADASRLSADDEEDANWDDFHSKDWFAFAQEGNAEKLFADRTIRWERHGEESPANGAKSQDAGAAKLGAAWKNVDARKTKMAAPGSFSRWFARNTIAIAAFLLRPFNHIDLTDLHFPRATSGAPPRGSPRRRRHTCPSQAVC